MEKLTMRSYMQRCLQNKITMPENIVRNIENPGNPMNLWESIPPKSWIP